VEILFLSIRSRSTRFARTSWRRYLLIDLDTSGAYISGAIPRHGTGGAIPCHGICGAIPGYGKGGAIPARDTGGGE